MAAPQNHWKLGLFVVSGLALAVATVGVIGARSMRKEVGVYVSYFDESVQGVEVGSPIKFRGVTIGTVGKIQVAPDHRHVEVESELGVKELARLGLDVAAEPGLFGAPPKLEMAPDLRLQMESAGLTGVKFLQLDFFDVAAFPPPDLPFTVPPNYIPTARSMMKSLEDSLTIIVSRLPEITDKTASIMSQIDTIVRGVNDQGIPKQISDAVENVDRLVVTARKKIGDVDTAGISSEAKTVLAGTRAAVDRLDTIMARINRDDGLLTKVERASDAVGDTLRDADGVGGQLLDTLVSLQASARSIRRFTEALEQDPDMLVKGRSVVKEP